ncbi:hypothetical protein DL771_001616 [Monosporascus sp. 5C6A]|nr:hypothetical protein DL771_001616 [Monosporascus sp. 5C6A]
MGPAKPNWATATETATTKDKRTEPWVGLGDNQGSDAPEKTPSGGGEGGDGGGNPDPKTPSGVGSNSDPKPPESTFT